MDKRVNPAELIVNVARDNPAVSALGFIRDDPDGINHELLEGGAANYVYKVTSQDKQSTVVIKYGEKKLRLYPDEELSMERQMLEYNCLKQYDSILPGSVPTPFCLDTKNSVIVMQDMSGWELLCDQLKRQHVDQAVATHLGHLLGQVHTETSHYAVTGEHWQQLLTDFRQDELKAFDLAVLYERPFIETDPLTEVPDVMLEEYCACVREVRELGLDVKLKTLFNAEICLVHGDCHHGAVFVKDGHAALFDFELAFIGHPALHVAFLLAGYMNKAFMNKAHRETTSTDNTSDRHHQFNVECTQAISNLLNAYLAASHKDLIGEAFFSELTLFVGGIIFMSSVFAGQDKLPEDCRLKLDKARTIMTKHSTIHTSQHFRALCDTVML